jgi:ABC-type glycerol-3-phosphate transport system substrate-binding protein
VPAPQAFTTSEILQAVWLDALFATRRGQQTLDQALGQLEAAVELLVPKT